MSKKDDLKDLKDLNEQIRKYEAFLNETLRGDLVKVTNLQEDLLRKLSNYEEIRQFINSIKSGEIVDEKNCIKTQVDLGCNFYCQAKIVDTQRIVLYLGLNFYLEFTLDEALSFIEKKKQLLNSENDELIKKSCEIKANIKLVLDTLRQLQGIDPKDFYQPRIDL